MNSESYSYSSSKKYYQTKGNPTFYPENKSNQDFRKKIYNDCLTKLKDNFDIKNTETPKKTKEKQKVKREEHKDTSKDYSNRLSTQGDEEPSYSEAPTRNRTFPTLEEQSNESLNFSEKTVKEEKEKNNPSPPLLDLSNQDIKEAYYVPKKISQIYNMLQSQIQMQRYNAFLTMSNQNYYNENMNNNNNEDNQNYYFQRANSVQENRNFFNNSPNLSYNYYSPQYPMNTYNSMENFNPITPFNLNEPAFSINNDVTGVTNDPLNFKNVYINEGRYSYSNSSNNGHEFQREEENTDILTVNVKVSKTEIICLKIRRFDDMVKTVQIFCDINKIDSELIKPLITTIFKTLNTIYQLLNIKVTQEQKIILTNAKKAFVELKKEKS
ncbi:MAG: hypothetical protein MJ252_30355 [archaeon]|nr:hypothetical protein [archaeon]